MSVGAELVRNGDRREAVRKEARRIALDLLVASECNGEERVAALDIEQLGLLVQQLAEKKQAMIGLLAERGELRAAAASQR